MYSYKEENILIDNFQDIELKATFYKPINTQYKATILYFHGGGFIFGHKNDLPEPYLELFAQNGYGLLAVDYPLAPEIEFPSIIESTNFITNWMTSDFMPNIENNNYYIMGRSAGAFLALTNGLYAQEQLATSPLGIISLYGYFNLNDASFSVPSRHYLQYPKINKQNIKNLIKKEPVTTDLNHDRFPIYLSSRQNGNWMELILTSIEDKKKYSLNQEQIKKLPDLFVASATLDPDVPTRQSRQLANIHPNADLHLINLDEHDFDRTHVNEHGLQLYNEIINWLEERH